MFFKRKVEHRLLKVMSYVAVSAIAGIFLGFLLGFLIQWLMGAVAITEAEADDFFTAMPVFFGMGWGAVLGAIFGGLVGLKD